MDPGMGGKGNTGEAPPAAPPAPPQSVAILAQGSSHRPALVNLVAAFARVSRHGGPTSSLEFGHSPLIMDCSASTARTLYRRLRRTRQRIAGLRASRRQAHPVARLRPLAALEAEYAARHSPVLPLDSSIAQAFDRARRPLPLLRLCPREDSDVLGETVAHDGRGLPGAALQVCADGCGKRVRFASPVASTCSSTAQT